MESRRPAPGPKPHFLFGNLIEFGRDVLGFFSSSASQYGDVVSLRLGRAPGCLINHPALFEYVLLTNNRNFIKHTFFWKHVTDIFGKGLVTNEGASWLRQRRLAQPAFHRDRIAGYGETMVSYTERMLEDWRAGQTIDLHHEMMELTMQIVSRTLFGVDIEGDTAREVGAAFDDALEVVDARFRRPVKIPEFLPLPGNIRYRRAVRKLDHLVYRFIEARRRDPGDDLLSMLMAARDEDDGSAMDDRQLRDEAVTIFLAGHETTALVLCWTLYLLATHPDEEAKLAAELRSILGERTPSVSDLPQLKWTTHVVEESMRLYPPAYAFGREALNDCEIGGYHIEKGTTVFLSPWVIHRDARFFEDPAEFRPQRWENDFAKRLPRFAYLPFGGGPRICIGNSFAMMEATLLLSTILQRFKLTLVPGQRIEPHPSITLRPRYGMHMTLHARS